MDERYRASKKTYPATESQPEGSSAVHPLLLASLATQLPSAIQSSLSCHTPFSKLCVLLGPRDLGSRKRKECPCGAQGCSTCVPCFFHFVISHMVSKWYHGRFDNSLYQHIYFFLPCLLESSSTNAPFVSGLVFYALDYSGRDAELVPGLN